MIRLWADFNDIRYGSRISTLLEFASSEVKPVIGERVELYDGVEEGQGNICEAIVTEVSDPIVYLELDWLSWTPTEDELSTRIRMTSGETFTGNFGFSFEVTERFPSPQFNLTNTRKTGKEELQPQ